MFAVIFASHTMPDILTPIVVLVLGCTSVPVFVCACRGAGLEKHHGLWGPSERQKKCADGFRTRATIRPARFLDPRLGQSWLFEDANQIFSVCRRLGQPTGFRSRSRSA